jgi:hypothetical protein
MSARRTVGVLVGVMLAAVSCGGGGDTGSQADPTSDPAGAPVEGQRSGTTAMDSTKPPESTVSESTVPSATMPPEVAHSDPILAVPDAVVISQRTATSGGGTRPLLEWEPVEGASEYLVIVFADDAQPYWSTITDRTAVHVGGAAAIPQHNDGPQVADGYSWAVYADDDIGTPIASSPIRSISP